MTLVYVVEDNPELLSDTLIWLNDDTFECYGAADANALDTLLQTQLPDVIVLDWMLPGEDGLAIAYRLRESSNNDNIGLVFMTARRNIDDRLAGLDVADAYMTKPIDYRELKAIISSVVRRLTLSPEKNTMFWQLHINKLSVQSPSQQWANLTERELIILMFLLKNPDKIIAIENIKSVIEEHYPPLEKNSLERLISRLRFKLKNINPSDDNPIRSYRHKGYRLTLPLIIYD
jgi:DNA-binding response OmpR family regulator